MSETLTQDKITIQEAAKVLNISRKTIYRWIEKGLLSRGKEGNRAYVSLADVRALCDKRATQQDTESVSGDMSMTQQDTNRVTLDRQHYEGLLIKLGQYEAERRYLLEYKTGIEAKDKELSETKAALATNSVELAEAKTIISKARNELQRLLEVKQDAAAKAKSLLEQQAALEAKEHELAEIREEVKRLRLPWWKRIFKR